MLVSLGCFLFMMVGETFQVLLSISSFAERQSLGRCVVEMFMVQEVKSVPWWLVSLTIAVNFMSFLNKYISCLANTLYNWLINVSY